MLDIEKALKQALEETIRVEPHPDDGGPGNAWWVGVDTQYVAEPGNGFWDVSCLLKEMAEHVAATCRQDILNRVLCLLNEGG